MPEFSDLFFYTVSASISYFLNVLKSKVIVIRDLTNNKHYEKKSSKNWVDPLKVRIAMSGRKSKR